MKAQCVIHAQSAPFVILHCYCCAEYDNADILTLHRMQVVFSLGHVAYGFRVVCDRICCYCCSYVERLLDYISNGKLAKGRRTAMLELQSIFAESAGAHWSLNPEPLILGTLNQISTNLLEVLDILRGESDPDLVDLLLWLLKTLLGGFHRCVSHVVLKLVRFTLGDD